MTAPTALLRLDDVSKSWSGRPAVRGVSLEVRAGEAVALVGESGSGKSTVARLALGLLRPDGGAVAFEGRDPARLRARADRAVRGRLQFVPQHPRGSLNPALRAGEAVGFALRAHGVPRRQRAERIGELFRQVGLAPELARRLPRELSGGQLQRVAVARALATGPALVVCDEPTSALDPDTQRRLLDLLTELRERTGTAYLFVSHDLAAVARFAHRTLVLRAGRVVEQGDTRALWDEPQHPYTQALLAASGPHVALRDPSEPQDQQDQQDPYVRTTEPSEGPS
ncbi:ABC transporter ATP-binding protein [Kitasatospora sp. NPDC059795]|uniref:ABC transporter ATP-binding protein n=1 Tax=Kitasatospora sp. NPDC059795 TaxID=3346949 RepID=UPI0036550196